MTEKREIIWKELPNDSWLLELEPPLRSWRDVAPKLMVMDGSKIECVQIAINQLRAIRDEVEAVIYRLLKEDEVL